MSLTYTETFTTGTTNNLDTYDSDYGYHAGTRYISVREATDRAELTATWGECNYSYQDGVIDGGDQTVKCTVMARTTDGGMGPAVRSGYHVSLGGGGWHAYWLRVGAGGSISLRKQVGTGSSEELATGGTCTAGNSYEIIMTVTDTATPGVRIRVYVNGNTTPVIDYEDTAADRITGSGYCGFGGYTEEDASIAGGANPMWIDTAYFYNSLEPPAAAGLSIPIAAHHYQEIGT